MICRIDLETGQARKPTHARRLQRWAKQHEEKTRGRLVIPNRRDRRLVREFNSNEIRAAVKENRDPVLRKLPPMKPKPVRNALGRVTAPRTDEERASFRQLRASVMAAAPSPGPAWSRAAVGDRGAPREPPDPAPRERTSRTDRRCR